ncbi:peptide deformylase [Candidatus Gottesmanbacteria bacterium RBG_13_45_10]|uniref:Peptide deformylase n=1 Tax=Candidatus Gottesmanbacteria bacterium RBG_13_45_10 TaxID=1798370 RepID=A0A1F5ZH72_9BACT|nr:MAG: peptide deformylase [Candidatus Gottesmanbacteria bacterium RBG_13_45_10]
MSQIVTTPSDILTAPAKTITFFDKRLARLIVDMKKTLIETKNPRGVGLAGPQVGESYRIFVTRPTQSATIRVFVNPTILKYSDEQTDGVPDRDNKLEGCLSIPNVWGKVTRSKRVRLRFQDQTGATHEEEFTGFLATIIQHETDHTNGVLFTRRVIEQQGKLYENTRDKEGKESLEEITLQ